MDEEEDVSQEEGEGVGCVGQRFGEIIKVDHIVACNALVEQVVSVNTGVGLRSKISKI